jgi:hypothetical protein
MTNLARGSTDPCGRCAGTGRDPVIRHEAPEGEDCNVCSGTGRITRPTTAVAFVSPADLSYMTVGSGVLGLPGCRTVRMPRGPAGLAEVEFEATTGTLDLALIQSEIERMGARVLAIRGDDR